MPAWLLAASLDTQPEPSAWTAPARAAPPGAAGKSSTRAEIDRIRKMMRQHPDATHARRLAHLSGVLAGRLPIGPGVVEVPRKESTLRRDWRQALASRANVSAGASQGFIRLIGLSALGFSALYFVSDLIELLQGGFSTAQLALTYAAEAAIPLFVLGLYALQRPRIGRLGLVAALAYAYAFVFFTSTVVFALIDRTNDWNALTSKFGAWIAVHSALMVIAGIAFGVAIVRARVLPRWTGLALILGMFLMTVATAMPDVAQTAAAGVRDLAFAGMGVALLRHGRAQRVLTGPAA
jgi:hypothetical protein